MVAEFTLLTICGCFLVVSGAAFGVVATGWLHYWWNFLEFAVGKRIPATSSRFLNTVTKVAIDQMIVSLWLLVGFVG